MPPPASTSRNRGAGRTRRTGPGRRACRAATTGSGGGPASPRMGPHRSAPLRLDEGRHAAHAVGVAAVGEAGVDPGDDRLAPDLRRVEIGVEDAGGAGELELA